MSEGLLNIINLHLKDKFSNKIEVVDDILVVQLEDGTTANIEVKQLKTIKQNKIY